MRVTVVGCSGSVPGPESPASSYLLSAPDPDRPGRNFHLVLDLGNGALGPLQRHVALPDIDAVALSHLHPDHCLDVCGLYVALKHGRAGYAGVPGARLPVLGPAGVAERLARAYQVEAGPGSEPDPGLPTRLAFAELADRSPVRLGPFVLVPYRVRHPVEAYGLRVECGSAVLAYTGDTDACAALEPLCAGASMVLADAGFVDGVDTDRGIHLSGERAARAAVAAGGVRRLVLTHVPPWTDPQVCRSQAAAVWPGEVELASPGATYEL